MFLVLFAALTLLYYTDDHCIFLNIGWYLSFILYYLFDVFMAFRV